MIGCCEPCKSIVDVNSMNRKSTGKQPLLSNLLETVTMPLRASARKWIELLTPPRDGLSGANSVTKTHNRAQCP